MEKVNQARAILRRSIEVNQMMMVVGEEGTSAEDYIIYQKGELLDAVYLQQNSFDPIDAACSPERQRRVFAVIYDVLMRQYKMTDKRRSAASSTSFARNSWTGTTPSLRPRPLRLSRRSSPITICPKRSEPLHLKCRWETKHEESIYEN